jgi:hypothetical protein
MVKVAANDTCFILLIRLRLSKSAKNVSKSAKLENKCLRRRNIKRIYPNFSTEILKNLNKPWDRNSMEYHYPASYCEWENSQAKPLIHQ